jgi:hypothetical protein
MHDLDFFFPETVSLETRAGSTKTGLRAQIAPSKILLFGDQVVVDVDDAIVHTARNGAVQRYSVLDVHYQAGEMDLPAVTTLKVEKQGSKAVGRSSASQHTYNLSGDNARINIRSTDNSINTVNAAISPVFNQLRTELERLPEDHPQKIALLKSVDDLSTAPPNSQTFTDRFNKFMSLAANCVTVVTPFLPEITKMLGH